MKLLNIEKVRDGRFLKNYEITYKNKKNLIKKYEMVSRSELSSIKDLGNKIAGVSIVVTNRKLNKILLLKEYRMAVNKEIVNVVSGLLDKDESIEDCIKRELFEETGITDINIEKILKPAYSAVGISDEKVILAYVNVSTESLTTDNSSANESIKAKFYTKEEVKELLEKEEFASRTQIICYNWINNL